MFRESKREGRYESEKDRGRKDGCDIVDYETEREVRKEQPRAQQKPTSGRKEEVLFQQNKIYIVASEFRSCEISRHKKKRCNNKKAKKCCTRRDSSPRGANCSPVYG